MNCILVIEAGVLGIELPFHAAIAISGIPPINIQIPGVLNDIDPGRERCRWLGKPMLSGRQSGHDPKSLIIVSFITTFRGHDKVGGRMSYLSKVAKSRDMLKTADDICQTEKTWVLNQCWILGAEMDDDVMDQQKYASAAFVLAIAHGEEHGRTEAFKWALDIPGAIDTTKAMTYRQVNMLSGEC